MLCAGRGKTVALMKAGLMLLLLLAANATAATLKVASWNLRNYLIENRRVEGVYRADYPKPETEKAAIRATLLRERPDVLLVQEIGGEAFARELHDDLAAEGLEYPYWHVGKRLGDDRALAVFSREPLAAFTFVEGLDFDYFGQREVVCRGLMELQFKTGGVPWTLFNVHLKSRIVVHGEDPDAARWRENEARLLRDYIRERYLCRSCRYVVMGDFNSRINEAPLRRFLKVSDRILAQEVPLTDAHGECWTYHNASGRVYEQIDFALASPAWGLPPTHFPEAGRIVDWPQGTVPSDHRMLVIELEFPEDATPQ